MRIKYSLFIFAIIAIASVVIAADENSSMFGDYVDLSGSITHFYHGSTVDYIDFENGGKAEILAQINLHKMGWKGARLTIHGEGNYGESVNGRGGILLPVNTAMLYPGDEGDDRTDISSFYLTQMFSKSSGFMFGKINMLEYVIRRGSGGAGIDYFQNIGLVAPPSGLVPAYIFGAMFVGSTDYFKYTAAIYDPNDQANKSGLENPFDDGITGLLVLDVPVEIAGRKGTHGLKMAYSTMDGTDFESIDYSLPLQAQTFGSKDERHYIAYVFKQFIVQNPNIKDGGWGLFGQIGMSDGNPTALDNSIVIGIGGNSLTKARPHDKWGIGYFRFSVSDPIVDGLSGLGIEIENEYGLEAFYNIAVTEHLNITANIQYIDPVVEGEDNVTLVGIRTKIHF